VVVKDTLPAEVNVLAVTPSVGSCTWGIPGMMVPRFDGHGGYAASLSACSGVL
jgi:hypothetical protein